MVAVASLAALFITSPTKNQLEDTGIRLVSLFFLQDVLRDSGLNARIWDANIEDGKWGTITIVSGSNEDALKILDAFTVALSTQLESSGFHPTIVIEAIESRRCVALEWESRFRVMGITIVHVETTTTEFSGDEVFNADYTHRFAIQILEH